MWSWYLGVEFRVEECVKVNIGVIGLVREYESEKRI